ncbi:sensor domain-containing diguanylate cyclase [Mesorhizobium sp. INR15]|uniref:sensor domain-containing diguanylate cyclase n=1 Tax=Mesorhizobium sp. INR15 TaxID=2654248 RepID=UPI0018965E42|nr:sensor domain-containing diguanylate cyclase [Mesorhizobium sp. INR15]QPC95922.1 diguanylate cyclase [Mesorhizobium sp. INR15]
MTPILESKGFAAAVIDALASHLCVIDRQGVIIAVNRAWSTFNRENSSGPVRSDVGTHYLRVCRSAAGPGSEEGEPFALGVQSVLSGETELFQMEYPCHSPTQNRWFLGRVTPLRSEHGGAVISHLNITDRKLIELELARLAATDPLTGLPNRRFFQQTADLELERVRRFSASASVIMLDVDHFKSVNDTYGHALGDEALRCLTNTCRQSLRKMDVFARHGGEEFVILLPGTKEAGASSVAEKLRAAIAAMPVSDGQNHIKLTASFGVAQLRPVDQGIDAGLARADRALYAAKHSGRNCVRCFSDVERERGKLSA